jgi:hypothetical protein
MVLVEGVIMLIITAAIFMVAPGTLGQVKSAAPVVLATTDAALNASQANISTTVAGALNLSTIGLIMLGIGLMIAGFAYVRRPQ